MSAEEAQQPGVAEQAAHQAASHAAQQIARQALVKAGAILGAKGAAVLAAVMVIIALLMLLIILIVAVMGVAFQRTTAVWPVPVATDAAGNYPASGWMISSRYGWRDDPQGAGAEFHDGLDLANPQGGCPFGYHCGAPSMFDGSVQYVGWDQAAAGEPSKTGGGELVIVSNGQDDHQTIYAHLEPYRLYVQLQGRIDDTYGRYDDYRDYQPIGRGPLKPDLSDGGLEMTCLNDMPNFIPTRSGAGTVVLLYDRPANCTTTVVWGTHGDDWDGWIADAPGGGAEDRHRASLSWQTPIAGGTLAQDVALRFCAHLVPPPPPPPITDTATLTPEPVAPAPPALPRSGAVAPGQGALSSGERGGPLLAPTPGIVPPLRHTGKPRSCATLASGWTRCLWSLSDIPTERERFAAEPNSWLVATQSTPLAQPLDTLEDDNAITPVPGVLLPPNHRSTVPVTATQLHGIGGPIRGRLMQAATPTSTPIENQITLVATLPERL